MTGEQITTEMIVRSAEAVAEAEAKLVEAQRARDLAHWHLREALETAKAMTPKEVT